jgi:hypothetical protein
MNALQYVAFRDELEKISSKTATKRVPVTSIIGETGEPPQGIGFRKTVHKALGKELGLAVNDPAAGDVKFYGKLTKRVRDALALGSKRAQKKGGFKTVSLPTGKSARLSGVSMSKTDFNRIATKHGYTPSFLRELGKKYGFIPSPNWKYYSKRYRLTPSHSKAPETHAEQTRFITRWGGKLPKAALDQILGKAPMYRKQVLNPNIASKAQWDPKHLYTPDFGISRGQTPADPMLARLMGLIGKQ